MTWGIRSRRVECGRHVPWWSPAATGHTNAGRVVEPPLPRAAPLRRPGSALLRDAPVVLAATARAAEPAPDRAAHPAPAVRAPLQDAAQVPVGPHGDDANRPQHPWRHQERYEKLHLSRARGGVRSSRPGSGALAGSLRFRDGTTRRPGHNETVPMIETQETDSHSHNPIVRYFKLLGPGLVTGASDDDPSGITTYSVAGASLGYSMLWTAIVTFPLIAAVQLICARIGLVSGRGLAGALRHHYPRTFLYAACLLLLAANVFNIAADLAGMGESAKMLTGIPTLVFVPLFGVGIMLGTVYTSYATFARYLKWMTAMLFSYIAAAFIAGPNWRAVLHASVVPEIRWDSMYVGTLVGVLGTTISPYLLFALGLIGTGLLAVPILAGSASFATAEVFGWRSGLDLSPRRGRRFYLVFAGAIVGGMLIDAFGTNPIRMLFFSAVVNGILAPPLLVLVMLVSSNPKIMGEHTNGVWLNVLGWASAAVMAAAAVAFFLTA